MAVDNSILRTVAGTGARGARGDGGLARWAELTGPNSLAFRRKGELFVAEYVRNTVRIIDIASGTIDTLCGTGRAGRGGEDVSAHESPLNNPQGLAIDDERDRLYIAEFGNNRIRWVQLNDKIVRTIAGPKGESSIGSSASDEDVLRGPVGLAVGAAGQLYVADQHHNRVVCVDPDSGEISLVAGVGARGFSGDGRGATLAHLNRPSGVAVSKEGILYLSDEGNCRVRRVDNDGVIETIVGTGKPGIGRDGVSGKSALVGAITYLALDLQGRVLIADPDFARIRRWAPEGERIDTIVGSGTEGFSGDGGPGPLAELQAPNAAVAGLSGEIYVADQSNHRVRCLSVREYV
jgi:sugar lactone lactonase YvrE